MAYIHSLGSDSRQAEIKRLSALCRQDAGDPKADTQHF
jgi:hypothetical protein